MKTTILLSVLAFLVILTACTPASTSMPTSTSTPTQTQTTSTTMVTTNLQPIEVVSAIQPLEMPNPGGPPVEITLKNISAEPVISLNVTLQHIQGIRGNQDFDFVFNVAPSQPLLPDQTISAKLYLIAAGFSENTLYPLAISGSLKDGNTFAYTKPVRIKPQPVTDQQPIELVSALGPVPPFIPGNPPYSHEGWSAEITLKNVGDEPVVALSVTLLTQSERVIYSSDIRFGVTPSNPLSPGDTISSKGTMFTTSGDVSYTLDIYGTLQSGAAFHTNKPIQITGLKDNNP
jgi:hypothetical protein